MSRLGLCSTLLLVSSSLLIACSDDGADEAGTGLSATLGTESASASMSGPSTSDTDPSTSDTDPSTSDTDPSTSDTDPATDSDTEGSGDSFCAHQCESDADCLIMGADNGITCVDNLCTGNGGADLCSSDEECVAFLSGWTFGMACTPGGGECDAGMQVCLDIEGEGHCAVAPSEFITCDAVNLDEIPTTDIDGNPAVVCGQADAACHPDAYCWLPCQSDVDCATEAYPACNTDTGTCECESDAGCATLGSPQFSVCNGGFCGCGSDDDCLAGSAGDVCTGGGSCGCSDDAACEGVSNPYDGGAIECVGF